MRPSLRCAIACLFLLSVWGGPLAAQAASHDTLAERELGQTGLTTGADNQGSLSASSLSGPSGAAVDLRTGRLYVVDNGNNRILSWPSASAFSNHQAADLVIGQPGPTSNDPNAGGANPSASSLWNPSGAAVDSDGNLYVADSFNNRVLIYDAPVANHAAADVVLGQPSPLTSTANSGGLSNQSLSNPTGLALDSAGRLYVADTANNRVLQFSPGPFNHDSAHAVLGQPNTLTNTVNNGGVSAVSLNAPLAVAVDAQDNVYVADTGNHRVLEYSTPPNSDLAADEVAGQSTFAGFTSNAPGLNAQGLSNPNGVAVDAAGHIFVVDAGNNRVLRFNNLGGVLPAAVQVFGQGNGFTTGDVNHGGSITAGTFDSPSGVAIDAADNLLVTDFSNNRVLEYDLPADYGQASVNDVSPQVAASPSAGFSLTVNGASFVAGSVVRLNGSSRPTTFLSRNRLLAAIGPSDLAGSGPFLVTVLNPAPGGTLSGAGALALYARAPQDGTADLVFGQGNFISSTTNNLLLPGGANRLNDPSGVAVDQRTGRLFVADTNNNRVLSWPSAASLSNGQAADLVLGQPNFYLTGANQGGRSARTLSSPVALAVDGQGGLYVVDSANSRVLFFPAPLSSGMAATRVFGQGGSFTSGDYNHPGGTPTANNLFVPWGVALDGAGHLFISDQLNSRVLEFDAPQSGATANRVFGQPNLLTGTANYSGINASGLQYPRGVALDAAGNLWVGDNFNGRVLRYNAPLSSDTVADLVLGKPSFFTNTLTSASATSLGGAFAVALDARGNVFVSDHANDRVLEFNAPQASGQAAARVFGQPDMFTHDPGAGRTGLGANFGLALDASGNLFVADTGNSRVVEFDLPLPVLSFLPLVLR